MHSRAIATRNAISQNKIVAAAARIAEKLGIDLPTEIVPSGRDPVVASLKQRESIADLLEKIDAALPSPEKPKRKSKQKPEPEPEPETEPEPEPEPEPET